MTAHPTEFEDKLIMLKQVASRSPEMKRRVDAALGRLLSSVLGEKEATTIEIARATIATRQRRLDVLGSDLFRDPAWDMLLDLYVTAAGGRETSVTSLCAAAHVPTTTGLRYIAAMEQEGFLRRRPDQRDHRRTLIDPDTETMNGVTSILSRLADTLGC